MQVGTLEKTLPCKLTREEVEERGQEMASLIQEIDSAKEAEKARKKKVKEEIETDEAAVAKLAEEISTGMTRRDVKCEERRNQEAGTMEIVRLDKEEHWPDKDKGALVSSRPLKPAEQQISLITDHARGREDGEEEADEGEAAEGATAETVDEGTPAAEPESFDPEGAFEETGSEG